MQKKHTQDEKSPPIKIDDPGPPGSLPDEIWVKILEQTTLQDRISASVSCKGLYHFFKRQPYLLTQTVRWDKAPANESQFHVFYNHNCNLASLRFLPGSHTMVVCAAEMLLLFDCETQKTTKILDRLPLGGGSLESVSESMVAISGFDCKYHVYAVSDGRCILSAGSSLDLLYTALSKTRFFMSSGHRLIYYDCAVDNPEAREISLGELESDSLEALSDHELIMSLKPKGAQVGQNFFYFNMNDPSQNRMIVSEARDIFVLPGRKIYYISKDNHLFRWSVEAGETFIKDLAEFKATRCELLSSDHLLMTKDEQKIGGGMMSMYFYTSSSVDIYSLSAGRVLGNYTYDHTGLPMFTVSPYGYIWHKVGTSSNKHGTSFIVKCLTYHNDKTLKQQAVHAPVMK